MYEAQVRVKGTEEWRHVPTRGVNSYFDEQSVMQLHQMVATMQAHFPRNEYRIQEVKHEV